MAEFKVNKTVKEINERIRKGKAVVVNAEEMIEIVRKEGKVKAAQEVDVVTTGTFSPMCSSGLLLNIGQQPPVMKVSKLWLNNVPCYSGIAAVDAYLGATESSDDDPLNKVHPGRFAYGGAHVMEDLLRGKAVHLRAEAYGTDCYPRRELDKDVTLADLPNAVMLNPRNCYQNYNAAVNLTNRTIYTYMGPLKANGSNVNYATAGALSPLFNDPYFRTIGMGTRIFMGGGIGYVIGEGTQHVQKPKRTERGVPESPSGTLMLKGDFKKMNARYVRAQSIIGYGVSLALGVGIPIPMLNEEMAWFTGVSNEDISMPVKDYGYDYPNGIPREVTRVSFADLRTGEITVNEKKTATVPVTSHSMSLEVADKLKEWILKGDFLLTEKQDDIPSY
jgi:uncharacterized protein (DUF39 family)